MYSYQWSLSEDHSNIYSYEYFNELNDALKKNDDKIYTNFTVSVLSSSSSRLSSSCYYSGCTTNGNNEKIYGLIIFGEVSLVFLSMVSMEKQLTKIYGLILF